LNVSTGNDDYINRGDGIPWTRFVLCPETGGRIPIKIIYEYGVYFPDALEVMSEASH